MLIETDARSRAALGRVVKPNSRYLVTEEGNGVVVLTPAVVMTEEQAAFLRRPELVRHIDATYDDDPSKLARRSRASRKE